MSAFPGVLFHALVVRRIARRRLRSGLAVAAVALGVAAFLASTAVGSSIERTATLAVTAVSGGLDLGIEADAGVPAAWTKEIRGLSGVAGAAPVVFGWASVRGAAKGRALLVGVDPSAEAGLNRYGGTDGVDLWNPLAFAAGAGAIVSSPLAEEAGVSGGGSIAVFGPNGPAPLVVAGAFEPRGPELAAGGRLVVVTLATAQRLLGRGASADRIDVRVAPDADIEDIARRVVEQIADRAPPGLYVGPPRPIDPTAADVLQSINVALRIGAMVALLVGMFLIHHTVSVGVAERRREIGMLRALGATRGQVRRLFAGEAVLFGLVGSALGVLLGFLLALGALKGFAGSISIAYFSSEPAPAEIGWLMASTGLATGTLVALAAAWFPAARAAAEAPNDAIRRGPEEISGRPALSLARVAATAVLLTASVVFVAMPTLVGRWTGYFAAAFALLAYLAAAPAFLAVGARLLAPLLAARFGVPGRLAADQLARHPVRAALPAAALAVGLALVVETAGTLKTLSESTIEWMESEISGDLFVSSGRPVMGAGGGHTPLDSSLAKNVAAAQGVTHVVGVRFRQLAWRDTKLVVWAFDIREYRGMGRITVSGGTFEEVLTKLEGGEACIVSENLMRLHGVAVGDAIELPGARRVASLRVVGSFVDYSWPRGALIADRSFLVREFDDRLVDEFSVKLAADADLDAATRAIVANLGEDKDVVVMTARQLQDEARALLTSFFSLGHAQIAAALSVAFLGVVNAMWIAVVLRRRELGLLRAVGATGSQVTRSIVLEAAGLGVIGAACGLIGGAVVEWLAIHRVLPADTGWTFPMRFPWGVSATTAVLGVVTSALAGLVPARAAAGFSLREAVAEE